MSTDEELKAVQQSDWDAVAGGWERWDAFQEAQTLPVNEWLCRSAQLSAGKVVLDLASGSGQPAFTAARLVQPGGKVIASDIAPEMVEVVKRRAVESGVDNLDARVMDMESLEFPDASVDAVTCRWGYMFCPNLAKAMAESRRVIKPNGRLALAVWDLPGKNPWLATFVGVLNQIAPPAAPPDPNDLGPFRLSDRAGLEALLSGAGFASYSIESVSFSFEFDSPEQWWEFVFDIAAPIRNRILALDGAGRAEARRLVLAQASEFRSEGKIKVPAVNLCASGER